MDTLLPDASLPLSTPRHMQCQPSQSCFLVLAMHVAAGLVHGPDGLVQVDDLGGGVAEGGHEVGVVGLDRAHGVALDAGDLHVAAHGVAGQAQVVFQGDFCSVFRHLERVAHGVGQHGGGHGRGRADLALATDLGPGQRGVALDQEAHGGGGQQAPAYGLARQLHVVVQHVEQAGDDPRRARGRRRDHQVPGGVLLGGGHGVGVDEHQEAVGAVARLARAAHQGRRLAPQADAAREHALGLAAPAHGVFHVPHHAVELLLDFAGAAAVERLLVGQDQLMQGQPRARELRAQFGHGRVGVRGRAQVRLLPAVPLDEPAAHGVVLHLEKRLAAR